MIIDYITSLIRAFTEKSLTSKKGRDFIIKKITTFLLISATYILDMFILQSEVPNLITNSVISFYIINESIGVIENADAIGLPIPKALVQILKSKNS